MPPIHIDGPWFKDERGRTLMLRGVNLGGSSKVPFSPDGATHLSDRFFNHRDVSFIGRPFPLEEADEHFTRLRAWGFSFLRLLVTWEAIEHAGPGLFDDAYLEYIRAIVEKAAEHGIDVFIDPHQDVWSRFSGGDGAPGWTFEAVGFDIKKFKETGAAIVHQTHGDPFPRMIWPSNSGKLATATMFTLFFGGNDFAPETKVEGVPVQDFLQRHYIEAIVQVAIKLNGLTNVIGYGPMNEPLPGYIGSEDLNTPGGMVKVGTSPSPFQSMLLGSGIPQEVGTWKLGIIGERRVGSQLVNPSGVNAWLPDHECVWHRNGVWDLDSNDQPGIRRPHHFTKAHGRSIDFFNDYYRPFANRFAKAIRSVSPDVIIFIESEPRHNSMRWGAREAPNVVFAPHWYDGFVLYMKSFRSSLAADFRTGKVIFGERRIRRSFADQVGSFKQTAEVSLGGVPTLIGEFGIPFDLRGKRAYRTGNFRDQIRAMDRSLRAMEDYLLSYTLWNYTADNTNARGDQWNGEDLSIFSRDQQTDPTDIHSGGRALEAVVRPYPRAVAGEPLHMAFDIKKKCFIFEFRHDPEVGAPTEIFVPYYQYPDGYNIEASDGSHETDEATQTLIYHHSLSLDTHTIQLTER
ncbi:MAG TPA: cellulase family glycosylhydrolase [Anaerolineales bacterium]|nr:cellulase family glycosylhydrolase [Anaerolineales bacterium]